MLNYIEENAETKIDLIRIIKDSLDEEVEFNIRNKDHISIIRLRYSTLVND